MAAIVVVLLAGSNAVDSLRIAAPAPASAAAAPGLPCSWSGETDQRDVNIGAPDLDAFYWSNTLVPSAGTGVVIRGSYPRARYFSFHVYDGAGNALDSIYDQQIRPDAGSANPFSAPVLPGAGDRYTVRVQFRRKPPRPAADTLYVDPAAGRTAMLIYRVYVPQRTDQPGGSVPFPQVSIESADGATLVSEGACSTTPPPFGSLLWQQVANADYPSLAPTPSSPGVSSTPNWQRSFGNQLGNQQNAYLGALISRLYGQLVVIHTRAPTFPDSRAGQPVYGEHQLRYWSICTYDQYGQAGIGCAADYAAAIRDGWITYVVSDPGQRPINATAANGVTWLPWGGDQAVAQIVYRNMLPADDFPYAAERITPTSDPKAVMGPYYPAAVYCSKARFESGGWQVCFEHAAATPSTAPRPVRAPACRARTLAHRRRALAKGELIELMRLGREARGHRVLRVLLIEVSHSARLAIRIGTGSHSSRLLRSRQLRACRVYAIALPRRSGLVRITARSGRAYERRAQRA